MQNKHRAKRIKSGKYVYRGYLITRDEQGYWVINKINTQNVWDYMEHKEQTFKNAKDWINTDISLRW